MPRKRFLGASAMLHVGLFALIVLASGIHIHGRPMPPAAAPLAPIKLVDLPSPGPRHRTVSDSKIAYPHPVTATPYPTPRPTPRPTLRPKPKLAATPRPALKPKELAAYRKKLPELAHTRHSEAVKIAERLKRLGLDPSAAASMDAAVKVAINAGGDKMYHPTTPLASTSAAASSSAAASGSASAFSFPQAWASPSTPLQAFLDQVLPPDRGFDYQLTFAASGHPELRIRYRHGNLQTGGDLVFVENWDPGSTASPSVDVRVLSPHGKPLGHFTFMMPVRPGSSSDSFLRAMAGTAMLQWLQGGGP